MKYFIDTEFIESDSSVELLSIGIVAEDGRVLYLCNQDAHLDQADEWLIWNVYPSLGVKHYPGSGWHWDAPKIDVDHHSNSKSIVIPRYEVRDRVMEFVSKEKPSEFWGYYSSYDWVLFCKLFGRMVDLPKDWPRYCRDVKQLCDSLGNPKLPKQEKDEHHALADAWWTKQAYEFLMKYAFDLTA